jgi:hypothetical protein
MHYDDALDLAIDDAVSLSKDAALGIGPHAAERRCHRCGHVPAGEWNSIVCPLAYMGPCKGGRLDLPAVDVPECFNCLGQADDDGEATVCAHCERPTCLDCFHRTHQQLCIECGRGAK